MHEERRWHRGRNLQITGEQPDHVLVRSAAEQVPAHSGVGERFLERDNGIDQDCDIGPRADALDRVSRLIARVKVRGGCRGEMATGRKARDSDAPRVAMRARGIRAHSTNGTPGVLQHGWMARMRRDAIAHSRAAVMPRVANHSATGSDSCAARLIYLPPGQTTTAAPVASAEGGSQTVSDGLGVPSRWPGGGMPSGHTRLRQPGKS